MLAHVENKTIADLGFGGEFALWGFRTLVSGQGNACQLGVGFNRVFAMECAYARRKFGGSRGRLALNALKSFATQIAIAGEHKITLSVSNGLRLTQDEVRIVAVLAAAQSNQQGLCETYLSQLLRNLDTKLAKQAALTYGVVCANAGIIIDAPRMDFFDCSEAPDDFVNSVLNTRDFKPELILVP